MKIRLAITRDGIGCEGDVLDVSAARAVRWIANGIAVDPNAAHGPSPESLEADAAETGDGGADDGPARGGRSRRGK